MRIKEPTHRKKIAKSRSCNLDSEIKELLQFLEEKGGEVIIKRENFNDMEKKSWRHSIICPDFWKRHGEDGGEETKKIYKGNVSVPQGDLRF